MKPLIEAQLARLEVEKGIRILYACESGSRAWGFPSPDSDYDVRIIYTHPPEWYLSIDEHKDTLELPISDELDISGWELRKALRIFRKSNAVIYEWLQSPIVYTQEAGFREGLLEMIPAYFSARSVLHHHLGLVGNAYGEIDGQPDVKLKKYFYILRSLLSATWVRQYQSVPPMEFDPLLRLIPDESLLATIIDWRTQKARLVEAEKVPALPTLNRYIEQEMAACESFARTLNVHTGDTTPLNHLFQKWIGYIDD
jgi:uncharacterized protein